MAARLGHRRGKRAATGWPGLLEHACATLDLPVLARLIAAWRADDRERGRALERLAAGLPRRPARLRAEDRQLGGCAGAGAGRRSASRSAARWAERDDVTHAAMFALAAVALRRSRPTARWSATRSPGPRHWSAPPCAWCRWGRAPGSGCWPPPATRIPAAVARALTLDDDELGAAAPGQAVASALHETLYSRLFRS